MEKIIINQKAYLNSLDEVKNFISITYYYRDKMIVLPSYLYIPFFKANDYKIGSQDVSFESGGAFTGEVTASSLKDMGVKYTLVGHAETRWKGKVSEKIKKALDNGLKVILCVSDYDNIDRELKDITDYENVIISYEPVWAIGSNTTPSEEEIDKVSSYIKSKGFKRVFYGGSVNENNIERLNKIPNIDGFLIGGLTLKPDSIIKMIEVVSK